MVQKGDNTDTIERNKSLKIRDPQLQNEIETAENEQDFVYAIHIGGGCFIFMNIYSNLIHQIQMVTLIEDYNNAEEKAESELKKH